MGEVRHNYSHPVDAVYAKLTSEEHLRERSEQAGDRNIEVRVDDKGDGAFEIRIARDIESDIPRFAKKFVNPVNHVVDIVKWRVDGDAREGSYDVTVNPRIRVKGKLSIRPSGQRLRLRPDRRPHGGRPADRREDRQARRQGDHRGGAGEL